jgi:hypothetical protein
MWWVSSVPKPERRIRFAPIAFAIAIGIGEVQQLGTVGHVATTIARQQPGGDEQAICEDGSLVSHANTLGVFEDDDLVVSLLPWFDLGIDFGRSNPEPTGCIEVHLDWLGQQRISRVEVDFETRVNDERLAFEFGIRVRNLRIPLSVDATGAKQQEQHVSKHREARIGMDRGGMQLAYHDAGGMSCT